MTVPTWRKSTFSAREDCVEVAVVTHDPDTHEIGIRVGIRVGIRDSQLPDGAILWFTGPEWAAHIAGVKAGEFDLPEVP